MAVVKPRITIQEVDGSPTGKPGTLKFPNTTLTDNGDGSFTYTPAASGGQTTYDAIVAASGGTHTTLTAALAAASNGWRILVLDGETLSSNVSSSLTNLEIVGAGRRGTLIVIGSNVLTLSGAGCMVRNLGFTQTTGGIVFSSNNGMMRDCYFNWTSNSNTREKLVISGEGGSVVDSEFLVTGAATNASNFISMGNLWTSLTDNYFSITSLDAQTQNLAFIRTTVSNVSVTHNTFQLITPVATSYLIGSSSQSFNVQGNSFYTTSANDVWFCSYSGTDGTVSNNVIKTRGPAINIAGARNIVNSNNIFIDGATTINGIQLASGADGCVINGNILHNENAAAGTAISVDSGDNHVVSNNRIDNFTTGITITASTVEFCTVTGNTLHNNTTPFSDSGTATTAYSNPGVSSLLEKRVMYMKNTSGSTITAGEVVTFKSVAAGNEITTTTTGGDPKTFGVATASIVNNASGYVQILGKTTILKVNGTTDIAIGDHLSTFTTAGIAQKATAGHTVFAIALEAYTTDDSSGVIDALIIVPRMI